MTLLEIAVATALLAALITMALQMMSALGGQHRSIERRALALRTVQALAEQLSNTPYDDLTGDAAKQVIIPPPVAEHLPHATVSVTIDEEAEPVAAKRVAIELRWRGPTGQPAGPVRLVIWSLRDDNSLPVPQAQE